VEASSDRIALGRPLVNLDWLNFICREKLPPDSLLQSNQLIAWAQRRVERAHGIIKLERN
jgi:hypothetical protein